VGATFYNGLPTMIKKTQLARKSFGGIMIWEITQDASGELSLLRAIDRTLKGR
jgi:GH18 family chitinase